MAGRAKTGETPSMIERMKEIRRRRKRKEKARKARRKTAMAAARKPAAKR